MTALLISGGESPPRARLASRFGDFDRICAADSGLDIAVEWGLVPDIIVGDMDSVSDPALVDLYPSARVIRALRDKDESDTEMGMKALEQEGADRIVLAGGGGGRLDHLLAVRALFERPLGPIEWHTRFETVYLVRSGETFILKVARGHTISVFPLSRGARGMSSLGLVWPLNGLVWGPGDFGLSNRASEGQIRVSAGDGDLLVVSQESAVF